VEYPFEKTTSLVLALAKIHNFCIDQDDTSILQSASVDELRFALQTNGSVPLEHLDVDIADDNTTVPRQLIDGGEHIDDLPSDIWQLSRRRYLGVQLPRELLAEDIVRENNYRQPRPKGTKWLVSNHISKATGPMAGYQETDSRNKFGNGLSLLDRNSLTRYCLF
jgi:hypothetical protein